MDDAIDARVPGGTRGPGGPGDAHIGHDLEIVASLLDGDMVGSGRGAAARAVAECSSCAAIHRDLVVLAAATHALPTPARTVDFRLTTADAVRLREPLAASARLTGDMQTTASHASHDAMLVASLADHGLAAPERDAAEALVAACSLCAALRADLVALSAATRAMPTPARPRDHRLTPETAAGLRPKGWRRWIAVFGSSRDMLSRPLAVGLTTLGLAGLLVATVPSVLQVGGATSSGESARDVTAAPALGALPEVAADPTRPAAAAAAPSANAVPPISGSFTLDQGDTVAGGSVLADGASPQPGTGAVTNDVSKGTDTEPAPKSDPVAVDGDRTLAYDTVGISPMVLVSGAMLVVGLGLFLIRRTARRFAD